MSIPNPFRPVCGKRGGELPPGFRRLLACRFSSNQGFYTGVVLASDFMLCADIQGVDYITSQAQNAEMCVFSTRPDYGAGSYGETVCAAQLDSKSIGVYSFWTSKQTVFEVEAPVINQRNNYIWASDYVAFNGNRLATSISFGSAELHVGFGKGSVDRQLHALVFGLEIYSGSALLRKYIPALDADDRACFFETIEQKAVYSELSADFIPVY